ncbi:MAG: DUF2520 domain-containing protein [Anaerovoracaceae bacterium]
MKIGFIGAGKTGVSLGRYFEANNIYVSGYYSKTLNHAIKAASYVNKTAFFSCEELVKNSDIIFITTPDGTIDEIINELLKFNIQGKIICHCSGAKSSETMKPLKFKGATYCSVHPVQAMSADHESYCKLNTTFFTLEGDDIGVITIKNILEGMGNKVGIISPEYKSKYHGATAVASNLIVSICQMAIDMLMECGFKEDDAYIMLNPLITANVESICKLGTSRALTGPVERCDVNTVVSHLKSLKEDDREIYRLLSKRLIKLAEVKNINRNYNELKDLLEGKNEEYTSNI